MYYYYGALECADIHLDFSVLNSQYSRNRYRLFKVLMMCPENFFPKFMVSSNLNKKLSGDIMDYQEYLFRSCCLDFEMFNIPNYHFTKLLSKFVDPYAIILKKKMFEQIMDHQEYFLGTILSLFVPVVYILIGSIYMLVSFAVLVFTR